MNHLVKCLILGIFLFSSSTFYAQSKKAYKIRLVDNDSNSVEFFLLGNNETLLKSNSDGILQLTKYQARKYKNEKFKLHFSNHLAYLVYRINLYFEKGKKTSDKHIKYNQITIEKLTPSKDNTFYLRRKEIRLDDKVNE